MPTFDHRRVVSGDIPDICEMQLAPFDYQELLDVYDDTQTAQEALRDLCTRPYFEFSVFLIDDKPEAIFGLSGGSGCDSRVPWFLCTDKARRYPKEILKRAAKVQKRWDRKGYTLSNWVKADNTGARRLLKYLGYTVDTTSKTWGRSGAYHPFKKEN